mmetsp:Transcript_46403/g.135156  ORF Transcript_46403/g.135156 Transcript_46403/m.135156 type:complete len:264 (-) Transcript_46403:591-1382(-)
MPCFPQPWRGCGGMCGSRPSYSRRRRQWTGSRGKPPSMPVAPLWGSSTCDPAATSERPPPQERRRRDAWSVGRKTGCPCWRALLVHASPRACGSGSWTSTACCERAGPGCSSCYGTCLSRIRSSCSHRSGLPQPSTWRSRHSAARRRCDSTSTPAPSKCHRLPRRRSRWRALIGHRAKSGSVVSASGSTRRMGASSSRSPVPEAGRRRFRQPSRLLLAASRRRRRSRCCAKSSTCAACPRRSSSFTGTSCMRAAAPALWTTFC